MRLLATLILLGVPLFGQAPKAIDEGAADSALIDLSKPQSSESLHLVIGRALILRLRTPLKRVYIGEPTMLQSFLPTTQELVLTAKIAGTSSLVLWDMHGRSYNYTVQADSDCSGLRAAFAAAFPGSTLSVESREGRLLVSGIVANQATSDAALKLAQTYAKDVINAIQVQNTQPVHAKQVQLKLRIVEVDRTRAEQFGFNFLTAGGRTASSVSTGQFSSTVNTSTAPVSISDPLNFFLYNYKLNLGITLKDAESKQILQVLAEPTITTMSGVAARFLSGGEIPVPVVEGGSGNGTAISIVYQPYGVKVDFTPTVNPDGTIHLKVSPEVSSLDYTNSVTLSGTTIPALSTRRADTEVEIRDGESFVVSGILDHRTTNSLASVPGIANIPILGQLFRSRNTDHSVVELIIMVTATVVDPLTKAPILREPAMIVPNLDNSRFDTKIKALLKSDIAANLPSALFIDICSLDFESDADLMLSALAHKGYAATIQHSMHTPKLRIVTGPYNSEGQAQTALQHLLADGFNAELHLSTARTPPGQVQ